MLHGRQPAIFSSAASLQSSQCPRELYDAAGSQLHLCYGGEAERNCRLWHANPHSYSNCFSTSDRAWLTGIHNISRLCYHIKGEWLITCSTLCYLIMTIRFLTSYQWKPIQATCIVLQFLQILQVQVLNFMLSNTRLHGLSARTSSSFLVLQYQQIWQSLLQHWNLHSRMVTGSKSYLWLVWHPFSTAACSYHSLLKTVYL